MRSWSKTYCTTGHSTLHMSTNLFRKELLRRCSDNTFWWFLLDETIKNTKSGITVALVNIPLSISLALAGGASPVPGIATAFWCGLASAIFGGSEFNIVGPTGALSGILAAAASMHQPHILPWLSIFSGVFTLIIRVFNLVDFFLFIPVSLSLQFSSLVLTLITLIGICRGRIHSRCCSHH